MSVKSLVCREMVELMTEYLEGTLSASDRARFEAHLGRCDGCTEYLAQLRAQVRMAGRLSESSLEPQFRDRLLAAFRDWRNS
jgi:anti-sigma factor RsiW